MPRTSLSHSPRRALTVPRAAELGTRDIPNKHAPQTPARPGCAALRGPHTTPTATSSPVGSREGLCRLTGRRNSRCSCARSSRYLFREQGSAIATATARLRSGHVVPPPSPSPFSVEAELEGPPETDAQGGGAVSGWSGATHHPGVKGAATSGGAAAAARRVVVEVAK